MDVRKAMDGRAVMTMLVLCLIWSMQQIGIKATADDIAPVLQIALRSGIAAVLVAILMQLRRERFLAVSGAWLPGLAAGLLFALEYLLLGAGLVRTTAAHAVVFLYTGPLFAALGLHLKLPSERLAPVQWLGILLSFAGVAAAFFVRREAVPGENAAHALLGDALCLAAGAAWGATTVVVRTTALAKCSATQTVLYQLVSACVLLLAAAAALGQLGFRPTPLAIANLAFQSVIVSFVSLLLWFALLRRYLASPLGVFSFMTPLFGVMLGACLLGEKVSPGFLIGAVLVLLGIVLVSGQHLRRS